MGHGNVTTGRSLLSCSTEMGWIGGVGSSQSSSPPPPHFLGISVTAGDRQKLFLANHNNELYLSC